MIARVLEPRSRLLIFVLFLLLFVGGVVRCVSREAKLTTCDPSSSGCYCWHCYDSVQLCVLSFVDLHRKQPRCPFIITEASPSSSRLCSLRHSLALFVRSSSLPPSWWLPTDRQYCHRMCHTASRVTLHKLMNDQQLSPSFHFITNDRTLLFGRWCYLFGSWI